MKAYVGVTDSKWWRFLAANPNISEVNFWQPGGAHDFKVLQRGEQIGQLNTPRFGNRTEEDTVCIKRPPHFRGRHAKVRFLQSIDNLFFNHPIG